jgi:hypothetical protein
MSEGVGGHRVPLVVVVGEGEQAAGDRRARRFGAARDEQTRLLHDATVVHRAALHLRMRPQADQVVLRLRARLFEQRRQHGAELHDRLHELAGGDGIAANFVGAHQPFACRLDEGPLVLGKAEQECGHARRQRRREFVDEVDLATVDEDVGQFVEQLLDQGLKIGNAFRREAARYELALLGVLVTVEGDRVLLARRADEAVTLTVDEHVVATFDVDHIRVGEHAPDAVDLVPADGTLRA